MEFISCMYFQTLHLKINAIHPIKKLKKKYHISTDAEKTFDKKSKTHL